MTDDVQHLLAPLPSELRNWINRHLPEIGNAFDPGRNGHLPAWQEALAAIPHAPAGQACLSDAWVYDGTDEHLDPTPWQAFHPWRKGPYRFGDLPIDTEWRSDLKWDRIHKTLGTLQGCRCLDVGCGNGYHLWRMCGDGASLALGLDPYLLYVMQFLAVAKRLPGWPVTVLPLGWESLSGLPALFDRLFCMGVLYHCRDPLLHLRTLSEPLQDQGCLILETLTVPDAYGPVFQPEGRYACMRNVHALPTLATLTDWLREGGFPHVRHIDTTYTTFQEQRSTAWMRFHSLADFLDPENPDRTVEGHPAPRRSIVFASKTAIALTEPDV
jgi:tRNA (mo5U34)-methyltransferase